MGYNRQREQQDYRVTFGADSAYPGFRFKATEPGLDARLAGIALLRLPADASPIQRLLALSAAVDGFASALLAWNLEAGDDDHAVPPTRVELGKLDVGFLYDLLDAWAENARAPEDVDNAEPEAPAAAELDVDTDMLMRLSGATTVGSYVPPDDVVHEPIAVEPAEVWTAPAVADLVGA